MIYCERIKLQAESYLDQLHDYRMQEETFERTAAKAREAFKQKRSKKLQTVQKEYADYESKKAQLDEMKKTLEALSDEIGAWIKRRVSLQMWADFPEAADPLEYIEGEENFSMEEKIAACDKNVTDKYAELLSLRKKYAEVYAPIAPTLEKVEKTLDKSIASKKKQMKELEKDAPLSLEETADKEEQSQLEKGFALIEKLAINHGLDAEEYPELLRLAALASARPELARLAPRSEDPSLSVVCNQFCNELLRDLGDATALKDVAEYQGNRLYQDGLTKETFEDFGVRYGRERALVPPDGAEAPLFLSENFLCEVLAVLEEEPEINLPRLAIRLIGDSPVKDYLKQLKEFKRLYEETPEERLVTEQRYYQQKMLEEAQEKNRLLAQQMEEERDRYEEEQREEERRYRQEQRERERRERELEREHDRERRREEERERARKQEQKRAEDARRREEAERRRREDSETRHQCNTCANAGHCSSFMHRPNCASYRPR